MDTKYIRPTDSDKGHTNVYSNGGLIGYFLPNRSKFSARNENWNFVSKIDGIPHIKASNRKDLINKIESHLKPND